MTSVENKVLYVPAFSYSILASPLAPEFFCIPSGYTWGFKWRDTLYCCLSLVLFVCNYLINILVQLPLILTSHGPLYSLGSTNLNTGYVYRYKIQYRHGYIDTSIFENLGHNTAWIHYLVNI